MRNKTRALLIALCASLVLGALPGTGAATTGTPSWVKPALDYLVQHDYLSRQSFAARQPMKRKAFKALMNKAFGGYYRRSRGYVKAGEVSAALVRALRQTDVARHLNSLSSPSGWSPSLPRRFGAEIAAREMGLRHDWPPSDEQYESSDSQRMKQADIAWAVWQAKTISSSELYTADSLLQLSLPNYGPVRRRVIHYALSQVGSPYIWGGEWGTRTGSGYPYGAQSHGGFDCSGFAWYVLQARSSSYSPPDRPYKGWSLNERTAADMAGAAPSRIGFKHLRPGDLLFFASAGRDAAASSVYHTGIYLGRGWMIHSSGSRDGVSISYVGSGSWWRSQFAWGRRVIKS